MFTCTRAHVHTCRRAHVHTCIRACAYVHTCIRAHVQTCTRAYVHTCRRAHVQTGTRADVHTCRRAHVQTGTRADVHTCLRAHPKHGTGVFTKPLWVQQYTACPEICSVTMMRRWLAETATQRRPSVQMEINGRAVLQTPVFFNLQAKSLGEPLVSNTIADERKAYLKDVGVDVIEFKGHSLRGASL